MFSFYKKKSLQKKRVNSNCMNLKKKQNLLLNLLFLSL